MAETRSDQQRKPPKKLRKLKKIEKEAQAARLGVLKAEQKMAKKETMEEILEKYARKQLEKIDPVETIAIIGVTVLVHEALTNEMVTKMLKATQWFSLGARAKALVEKGDIFGVDILKSVGQSGLEPKEQLMSWILSFAIAYILIKHGGQILGGIGGEATMTGIVGMFFA